MQTIFFTPSVDEDGCDDVHLGLGDRDRSFLLPFDFPPFRPGDWERDAGRTNFATSSLDDFACENLHLSPFEHVSLWKNQQGNFTPSGKGGENLPFPLWAVGVATFTLLTFPFPVFFVTTEIAVTNL